MKYKPPITFLFLISILSSCGGSEASGDHLVDSAAEAAFSDWHGNLNLDWDYPLDFHARVEVSLSSPDRNYSKSTGHLILESEVAMRAPWDFAVNADADFFDSKVGGGEFSLSVSCDDSELLAIIHDRAALAELSGMDSPNAINLSTDRAEKGFTLFRELMLEVIKTPEFTEFGHDIVFQPEVERWSGFADLIHPRFILASFGSPDIIVSRWEVVDEVVQVEYHLNPSSGMDLSDLSNVMGSSEEDIAEQLAEVICDASFDVDNGFPRSFAIDFELTENCETHGTHPVEWHISLEFLPPQDPVSLVEFSAADEVMELDPLFDQYWPMVESLTPMIKQGFQAEGDAAASDEDFSF